VPAFDCRDDLSSCTSSLKSTASLFRRRAFSTSRPNASSNVETSPPSTIRHLPTHLENAVQGRQTSTTSHMSDPSEFHAGQSCGKWERRNRRHVSTEPFLRHQTVGVRMFAVHSAQYCFTIRHIDDLLPLCSRRKIVKVENCLNGLL